MRDGARLPRPFCGMGVVRAAFYQAPEALLSRPPYNASGAAMSEVLGIAPPSNVQYLCVRRAPFGG
eukprot:11181409-Lingulodinium_polyedra.AAC.1